MAGEADPFTGATSRTVPAPYATARLIRNITPAKAVVIRWAGQSTAALIAAAEREGARRIHLVGPRPHADDPGAFLAWAHAAVDGWDVERHYTERPDAPVLRWSTDTDGRRRTLELQRSSTWFGPDAEAAEPAEVEHALAIAAELIAAAFPGGVMLATPATTGRELWRRIIGDGQEWPVLDEEHQTLIRSTSGQGRIELVDGPDIIAGLHELDGRFMYGALCRELPGGRCQRWSGEHTYGPHARARVRAEWQVPDGWRHVGLLPAMNDAGGWTYPRQPGERATGWIDGAELALARSQGWAVTVHESLVWPDRANPLGPWAERIARARAAALHVAAPATVISLARTALRKVCIDALGAFVSRPHIVTRSAPLGADIDLPAGAVSPRIEGDRFVWGESTGQAWPELAHPEWPAAVWARCRVRLLDGPGPTGRTGALHVDPADVVAFRTDALYLAHRPAWGDDLRDGRLRHKGGRDGTRARPRTVAELIAARDEVTR